MAASLRSTRSRAKAVLPTAWAEWIIGSQRILTATTKAAILFRSDGLLGFALIGRAIAFPRVPSRYGGRWLQPICRGIRRGRGGHRSLAATSGARTVRAGFP